MGCDAEEVIRKVIRKVRSAAKEERNKPPCIEEAQSELPCTTMTVGDGHTGDKRDEEDGDETKGELEIYGHA